MDSLTQIEVGAPCSCPAAGWCDRHRMNKVQAQFVNCRTKRYYREYWDGLTLGEEDEREDGPPVVALDAVARPPMFKRLGVGDLIAGVTKRLGIRQCGGCKDRQKILNRFAVPIPNLRREAPVSPPQPTTYFNPNLPPNAFIRNSRWAVGVTTAPRTPSALPKSLESLVKAGFRDVRVVGEPGAHMPEMPGASVWPEPTGGPMQNWIRTLRMIYDEKPAADIYMMVQDDVLYAGCLREFMETDLWFDNNIGFISPYRSSGKSFSGVRFVASDQYMDKRDGRRERTRAHDALWGALTYVFPRESVQILLADEGLKTATRTIDLKIHRVLAAKGRRSWYYNPSLAEHMAGSSTLGHGQGRGMNSGGTFVGEDFDATTLLR